MSSNKLLPNDKLKIEENNLKRIISWINTSDVKVAAVLTFHIFLIGIIANKGSDIKSIWLQNQIDNTSSPLFLSLIAYIIATLFSCYFAFRTLFPDVAPRVGLSLLFFGTINILGRDKFKKEFRNLSFEDLEEDLLDQTYTNAEIASIKYKYVKRSIAWIFIGGCAWIITLFFIASLKQDINLACYFLQLAAPIVCLSLSK